MFYDISIAATGAKIATVDGYYKSAGLDMFPLSDHDNMKWTM